MKVLIKQVNGKKRRLKSTNEPLNAATGRTKYNLRWLLPTLYLIAVLVLIGALVISTDSQRRWFTPIVDKVMNSTKTLFRDAQ